MTSPWGNPPQLPNPPRTGGLFTVQVKGCCERLINEPCDCAQFAVDALAAFDAPILLPPHSDVPCLTDPALDVVRPGPDMVQAMESPLRWKVTPAGVEVTL